MCEYNIFSIFLTIDEIILTSQIRLRLLLWRHCFGYQFLLVRHVSLVCMITFGKNSLIKIFTIVPQVF